MNEPIESMAISKFKATCLAVLERVRRTGRPVRITRFGRPVADVVPPAAPAASGTWLGALRERGRVAGDLIAPAVESGEWEVLGGKRARHGKRGGGDAKGRRGR